MLIEGGHLLGVLQYTSKSMCMTMDNCYDTNKMRFVNFEWNVLLNESIASGLSHLKSKGGKEV